MLGPGSDNVVRLAYDVPQAFEGLKSELYFDVATGSAVFGVTEGNTYGAPAPVAEFDTEFMIVRVNQIVQLAEALEYPKTGGGTDRLAKGSVLLDVTFTDKPNADGYDGTRVPKDFFALAHQDYSPVGHGSAGANISTTAVGLGSGD